MYFSKTKDISKAAICNRVAAFSCILGGIIVRWSEKGGFIYGDI
jgi:hypothetical protein